MNAFVENDHQSKETQWAMENVKHVSRKFKDFSCFFLKKNWPKKKFSRKKSQHAARLKGVPSISAKTVAFPAECENRNKKYSLCPVKSPKIDFFW